MIHLILTLTSGVVSCGPRYRTAHLILTLTSGVVSCGPRYRTATSNSYFNFRCCVMWS